MSTQSETVLATNPLAYWPLWEAAGATAADESSNGFNGTYVNCLLGQPGMGDGATCPYFNGATSYVNVFVAPLIAAFDPTEFNIWLWLKADAGLWTDGASHVLFRMTANATNYILIYKPNAPNNKLYFQYTAGGTTVAATYTTSSTDWLEIRMSVSKTADELKAHVNGTKIDTTKNGLGTWSAAITSAVIGASTTAPALVWKGNIAHVAIGDPYGYPAGRLRIPVDAADVDSSGNIYAGRGSRIYKSTDGGDSWVQVYTIPGSASITGRVFCDSRDYVYVSGRGAIANWGLYRSTNGGAAWAQVLVTTEGTVWGIDEDSLGNMCCGLHGFGAGTKVQIWKCTDGGLTWVQKHDVDYGSLLQNHVHDVRYDTRTGYWYATLGDQINEKLLRSTDDGETWTVVSTGGTQLLAIAFLDNHVYIGTDTGSGNKIVRFTDSGASPVTLEDVKILPTNEDVAIFDAGEHNNQMLFLGYKEAQIKIAKLYICDGCAWFEVCQESASESNRGYYTLSPHQYDDTFYISNDYGSYADYGIPLKIIDRIPSWEESFALHHGPQLPPVRRKECG